MILNDNSTQQINTLVIQLQNRITNLNNELKSLNKEINNLDSEISDLEKRVSSNTNEAVNDAAAMNAKIKANTEAISGKADKNHTHIKSDITDFPTSLKNPNALTINGKTYDGSTAVDAGVQTVENGGTGVTTQADINKAFIGNLDVGESDVTDGTEFVSSYASDNGFAETTEGAVNKPYKRQFSKVWNYIKDKISSVLGLTATAYSNVQIGGAGVTGSKLTIQGNAVGSNSYTDANPKLEFKNDDGRQNISLTFTDADAVQAPSSLTLNGNQGNEYFIAPNIKVTGNFHGNLSGKADTAGTANKIEPNYITKTLTIVTTDTTKYIHLADCHWNDTGTLQVFLRGNCFEDTLVINFGGGNGWYPMLCGHYSGNSLRVLSVIAQKASNWNSDYSIYVKVNQSTDLTVNIALLKGNCTINISESTTAPTNIDEWPVNYGLFGNIAAPEITSLEQRVAALESKI